MRHFKNVTWEYFFYLSVHLGLNIYVSLCLNLQNSLHASSEASVFSHPAVSGEGEVTLIR